ncbi:hypothetical protein [Xanthomonas oryzae]|uniref:hypothetical protein n=1 Tax=Xanthomonas oryzae TaxID=347 RepID=UPI00338E0C24
MRNRAETISGVTRVATVAARNRLDLGVGQLSNTDRGLIYSDGDAAIGGTLDGNRLATGIARQIDNLGSTIEVAGDLDLHATTINNIRQNVVVTQTTTTLAPVRLDQPSWRNNGAARPRFITQDSNAYGTCTTNCVQLWAQFAYTDPDHILLNPQGTGGGRLGDQPPRAPSSKTCCSLARARKR